MKTINTHTDKILGVLTALQVALIRHAQASKVVLQAQDKVTYQQSWEEKESYRNLQDSRADLEELLMELSK